MYITYLQSYLGILEIRCSNTDVLSIKIVKKAKDTNENELTNIVKNQLNEYFNYERFRFDLPLAKTTEFKDRVYDSLINNPYGNTITYKNLASLANSKAIRAVGSAMANNPFFIVVPWHLVTKSNGELGEFAYGKSVKEKMVLFEKSYEFEKRMYKKVEFSNEEISSLLNHEKLGKMFEVMDIEKSLKIFKGPFANMISNIIYQQVAFKVARYSEVMLFDYLEYDVTPKRLLSLTTKDFNRFKITGRRIEYIRNFCEFVIKNKQLFDNIESLSDQDVYDILIDIKGIGNWTIEMYLLFGLGKKDVLSYGDLIIVNGLKDLYGDIDKEKFNQIKNEINDFASITSINLWKYMEQGYYKLRK